MFSPDLFLCLLSARPKMLAEIYGRLNTSLVRSVARVIMGREAVFNSVIERNWKPGQLTPHSSIQRKHTGSRRGMAQVYCSTRVLQARLSHSSSLHSSSST